jgi:Alkylmercury lyase
VDAARQYPVAAAQGRGGGAADTEDLRLAVYRCFAGTGRAPATTDLAHELGLTAVEVDRGLRELHAARHLVLDDRDQIVMAHPFSAVPLGFSVMGRETLWWGGCAWDSFALPFLLRVEGDVLVATRCPACAQPHAWNVGTSHPPPGDQVAHFLTPAARMWDDVVHTCRHQRIFCGAACVAAWAEGAGLEPGYSMDLSTLWRFASRWYEGRLDRGYARRDPGSAADYMRSSGLSGAFWGL